MGIRLLVYIGILMGGCLQAQDLRIDLAFVSDTTAIGMPIGLRMQVDHPDDVIIIFPQKAKDFLPFERISVEPAPTTTSDGTSIDVATYWIRTFEMDRIQKIKLPYGYVMGKDTVWGYTEVDSIQINPRLVDFSGKLDLETDTQIIQIDTPPNYFVTALLFMGGAVFLFFTGILLRKPLLKRFQIRQIQRQHQLLLRKWERMQHESDLATRMESLNSLWKSYMDPEDRWHLRSLTTTELKQKVQYLSHLDPYQQEMLWEASRLGDKLIYAGESVSEQEVVDVANQIPPIFEQELVRRKADLG